MYYCQAYHGAVLRTSWHTRVQLLDFDRIKDTQDISAERIDIQYVLLPGEPGGSIAVHKALDGTPREFR